jgi:hypothetical protein
MTICWLGYFCPAGASSPVACPTGYYGAGPTWSAANPGQYSVGCTAPGCGNFVPLTTAQARGMIDPNCKAITCDSTNANCQVRASSNLAASPTGEISYLISRSSQTSALCSGPCACAGGLYCPMASTTAVVACVVCATGSYCTGGAASPQACPAGTYGNTTGLTTAACSGLCACAPGAFCPPGSTSCSTCTAGSFCTGGAAPAVMCPAGAYGAASGLTSAACSGACSCAAGAYCPAGSTAATCVPCPAGSYCLGGAGAAALLCPVG